MTVDARWLVKLEAAATAFRLIVTVAAGMLGLAILAGVTARFVILASLLLLLAAMAGPLVHGWLAKVLREGRDWALVATLIATGALWILDAGTVLAVHYQNVVDEGAWAYWLAFALVSLFHLAALVVAAILYARERTEEQLEPDAEGEAGSELA